MNIFYALGIIASAVGGFFISRHIAKHRNDEHLACHNGKDCSALISGRYSDFLGIKNEKIGMFYYAAIVLFFVVNIFVGFPELVVWGVIMLAGVSFAFSLYLIVIQLFVVKKWCSLCLGSAGLSFLILVLAILGFDSLFSYYVFGFRDFLKIIFMIALSAGTLISTLHAMLMIKFFKDFDITKKESKRLKMFSQSAWLAIIIAALTGVGLVLTDVYGEITSLNSFVPLLVVIAFMVVYEIVLNTIIAPRLVGIHFGDHPDIAEHEHSYQRKLAFAYMGIGAASWYSALLLTSIDWFRIPSGYLFLGYIGLVILAVVISLLFEMVLYRKSVKNHSFIEEMNKGKNTSE